MHSDLQYTYLSRFPCQRPVNTMIGSGGIRIDRRNLAELEKIRSRLCQSYLVDRNYSEVINFLGQPTNQDDRDIAALCHYELAKQACLAGKFGEAKYHVVEVEQLKPTSLVMRSLNAARLKLLNTISTVPPKTKVRCSPGTVSVHGIGSVLVLDKYVTYGQKTDLTQHVRLLKKAPQELDEREIEQRLELIQDLGFTLCNAIKALAAAADVDMLVPIPPDPERYTIRMYHPPEAIAKAVSTYSAIPVEANLLHKTRETQSLRGLSQHERDAEIIGSIKINEKRQFVVKDRCILLVDDVVTGGTHLREAKKVLIQSGAGVVHACALAGAHGYIISIAC